MIKDSIVVFMLVSSRNSVVETLTPSHPQQETVVGGGALGGNQVCYCLVAKSVPTLCNPLDCSLPGSSIRGTFPGKILEWVAICSSRGSSRPGIELMSSGCPALAGRFFTTGPLGKPPSALDGAMSVQVSWWDLCLYKKKKTVELCLCFSVSGSLYLICYSVSCSVVSNSFVTLWTVAHQAPLSMEFSRQESWSGLPFPSPGDLPDP